MDNDGIVEDVIEENLVPAHSQQNFLVTLFNSTVFVFETYGWFILIGSLVAYYLYKNYKDKLPKISQTKDKEINEEQELKRMMNIQAARERQQAQFEAAKQKFLEEKKLKEAKQAEEKAKEWELHQQGLGYRSKTKVNDDDQLSNLGLSDFNKTTKKSGNEYKKSDYNPLTGQSSGGSCSWRPGKKGGAKGG